MRTDKIEAISLSAADLAISATDLLEYFNSSDEGGGVVFDVKKLIHGTDISYSDCISRIITISGVSDKFKDFKDPILVPLSRITLLKQRLDEAQQRLDALSNQFRQAIQGGGGFVVFNYDNFHLQTSNGQNHDLRAPFKSFADITEELLEAFFSVLVVLRPTKATYSFQAAANALSGLIGASSEELKKLHAENASLRKALASVEAKVADAKVASDEAVRLRDEGAKDRKTIGEYLADATEKAKAITTIHSSASSLEDEVTEYKETFQAFGRQLEARNTNFEDGRKKQEALFERYNDQKELVADLIAQSESMLKGATVAGLASSFSKAHEQLEKQLWWARTSFYFGIFFLFLSAIPLMVYIFLPILGPLLQLWFPKLADVALAYESQEAVSGWQYLGQVLARFVILLPAAWFVSFAAIRHSSLFRLREHYAYKYSMAVSVEGFRKQAEGYESEIAALVLEQLAFNPADKLIPSKEIKEGRAPHPMLNLFLEKFRSGLNKERE